MSPDSTATNPGSGRWWRGLCAACGVMVLLNYFFDLAERYSDPRFGPETLLADVVWMAPLTVGVFRAFSSPTTIDETR